MSTKRLMPLLVATCLGGGILTQATPVASAFNLDYQVTGRIWAPSLEVAPLGAPATDRTVILANFGVCEDSRGRREQFLEPRDRDCRFERQLADAMGASGLFPRMVRSAPQSGENAVTIEPRRSRAAFRRQMIAGVKPIVVLTLFTYLWTPLPLEVDVESYHLRLAILGPRGQSLSEVAVDREFKHYLSAYSAERGAPEDLLAAMEPAERDVAPVIVCRGPHAHLAAQELIQQLGVALRTLDAGGRGDPRRSPGERTGTGPARRVGAEGRGFGTVPFPRPGDDGGRRRPCEGC